MNVCVCCEKCWKKTMDTYMSEEETNTNHQSGDKGNTTDTGSRSENEKRYRK